MSGGPDDHTVRMHLLATGYTIVSIFVATNAFIATTSGLKLGLLYYATFIAAPVPVILSSWIFLMLEYLSKNKESMTGRKKRFMNVFPVFALYVVITLISLGIIATIVSITYNTFS